jgi:uncharacterized protein YpiB (UPF0302 family)
MDQIKQQFKTYYLMDQIEQAGCSWTPKYIAKHSSQVVSSKENKANQVAVPICTNLFIS